MLFMPGRLNAFQQSMLGWNDLHPYNAVHVVRIPESPEVERLKTVICRILEEKGLTGLRLDRNAGTYEYCGGAPAQDIRTLSVEPGGFAGLGQEIERQLNTPFIQGERFSPFRFFIAPGLESFSLGLVYFHPIADADCILGLLREIVETYWRRGNSGPVAPVDRHPARWGNHECLPVMAIARKLANFPVSIRNLRKSCRPIYHDTGNLDNAFSFFSLNPEVLAAMVQFAKSLGVTLNDLFLALLMKAIALLTPERTQDPRRKEISLGCIVNIRKDLGLQDRGVFGVFLGSFMVHHNVPVGVKLADVARDLRQQTLRIKQGRLYVGAAIELAIGRFMANLCSKTGRKTFYQKNYPLWGGLSNIDLNPIWPQAEEARPIDYFRAVSTGPVTPLVVSITTVARVVNIGLTYRSTVFSAAEIECIKRCFMEPADLLADNL